MNQRTMARMGGNARAKKLSAEHRKKISSEAALARWRKVRAIEASTPSNPHTSTPQPGAFGGTAAINR